jgi:4-alpha-glucanotransferase
MRRGYGILLPVFSLPSAHGIGDFGPEAYRFADLLAENGASYWQILPLNPGSPESGESPYFSKSSLAINPLLLSLERLRDEGLLSDGEIAAMPECARQAIDYDLLRKVKMQLLEKAAGRFPGDAELDGFIDSNESWLYDFALYDVYRNIQVGLWPEWPDAFRDRNAKALGEFSRERRREIRISQTLQYFAFRQWQDLRRYCSERRLDIVGDMPIYVSLDSSDAWANPGLFKLDSERRPTAVSGVPPDYFSATGQLWNNPVYDWEAHRRSGFSWWINRMRRLLSIYDILRIDHFRGLVQYWEIPFGETTAIKGKWVDVPTYEFFDALLEEITPFPVIAEDLGIITDDVRAAMDRYGFPGMKVLEFAFGEDNPNHPYLPENFTENCVVYTGTHDNMPFAGWLRKGASGQERERINRYLGRKLDEKETVWALIDRAMGSVANAAIFPLQDILALDESSRINEPSLAHGNWRWRWDKTAAPAEAAMKRMLELGKKYRRFSSLEIR